MNVRSVLCVAWLVLGAGCAGDVAQFVGTYDGQGQLELSVLGQRQAVPLQYTQTITEGISSDLVFSDDDLGCTLPANVEDRVATFIVGATCNVMVQFAGSSHPGVLQVSSGTATRWDSDIQLRLTGIARATEPGQNISGDFTLTMKLTPQAQQAAR